jgi:hypothetical protein
MRSFHWECASGAGQEHRRSRSAVGHLLASPPRNLGRSLIEGAGQRRSGWGVIFCSLPDLVGPEGKKMHQTAMDFTVHESSELPKQLQQLRPKIVRVQARLGARCYSAESTRCKANPMMAATATASSTSAMNLGLETR